MNKKAKQNLIKNIGDDLSKFGIGSICLSFVFLHDNLKGLLTVISVGVLSIILSYVFRHKAQRYSQPCE